MAADLIVSSISSNRSLTPLTDVNNYDITVNVLNQGTTAISADTPFVVRLFYVDNLFTTPTATAVAEQTVSGGLGIFSPKTLVFYHAPGGRPADNDGYLVAAVDTGNAVAESNESNNSYRGLGQDYLRYSMEADVSTPAGSATPRSLALDGKFINGVIGDEIIGEADIDTYKVTLQAGHHYWFEIDSATTNFATGLRLIDQQYQTLASATGDMGNNSATNSYIEYTPATSGDYYLAASNRDNVNGAIHILDNRVDTGGWGSYKIAAAELDPPTVVIASLDPSAIEGSPNDPSSGLEFTVTRQWVSQPWRPLTVKLEWSGQFNGDLSPALPTSITIPANQYSVKFTAMPVQDNVNEGTETEIVRLVDDPSYVLLNDYRSQTLTIFDDPATHHPFAVASDYIGLDRPGPRTFIQFDEDVSYSITKDDYTLKNLDTGAIIPTSNFQVLWSPTINASIVYFPGFAGGQLPDGNYRMTLHKNGVYTWPDGKQLANDVVIDFASLNGDTNGDRQVNFADLVTLAQNYNKDLNGDGGAANGDFNRDGKVDFSDLVVLAQNYNKHLAVPAAALMASSVASKTAAKARRADDLFSGTRAIA